MRFNSISELISSSFFIVVMDLSVHKYNVKQTKKRIINPLADYDKLEELGFACSFYLLKNNPIDWSGCSGLLLKKACPRETPQAQRPSEESDCLGGNKPQKQFMIRNEPF
ncbi:hypothetical protein [Bacillus sp. ISL-57]|uniref:hypothetical protein n=1 Tax=Bacillus sp. ISL-57 TaxID=2819135 RepID=UPI001BE75E37|nr:hypothetical protein [Bacillus sp. ISL-57]